MAAIIHVFHKKTDSLCPICNERMYMVYWHNKTKSFMCLKCHFGFNYNE